MKETLLAIYYFTKVNYYVGLCSYYPKIILLLLFSSCKAIIYRYKIGSSLYSERKWMTHLNADIRKAYALKYGTERPSFAKKLKAWVWYFNNACIAHFRLGAFGYNLQKKNKFLALIPLTTYMATGIFIRLFRHVEISYKAQIGPGFFIGHACSIFIGDAKIGKNCNLTHLTTIGWGLGTHKGGVPEIGDNVWIGPNCVISGNIKIGNDVVISAGSVVSKDIPDKCLVMGNPARVIQANYDNSSYFDYSPN